MTGIPPDWSGERNPQHMATPYLQLEKLLRQRLQIIGDHAWRDRDSAGHLDELKRVSEALMEEHQALRGSIPAQLNHFLTQASYSKALDFISGPAQT